VATESGKVVVFSDRDEVLLVLREDLRIWVLPGGRREAGETSEEAAAREVHEETGYTVELERAVGDYCRPQFGRDGDRQRVYVGHVTGGDRSAHDWESADVRWFPVNRLPRLHRFCAEQIEDALADAGAPFEREQRLSQAEAVLLRCAGVLRRVGNRVLGRH
jgi:8-oxo-dGTP pyrophosphatase MutT (NUDIX family)